MEHKYHCELIHDLLPLYRDEICTAFSRRVVEDHLLECPDCQKIMERLKNDQPETQLSQEKDTVLKAHFQKERRVTFVIGAATAGILMIPVIVCLICNLAIGHGLDWFFIVLTALLLTASVTVVPLMMPEHTGLWTLGSFTLSLLLLLFTVCLYTGGNWFFLASVPTLFGLSVLFMPFVIGKLPLSGPLARNKALLVMAWDTLLLYGVIAVCGFHTVSPDYWRISLQITSFCVLYPWALLLIIRYTKSPVLLKAGLCTVISGLFVAVLNPVILLILHDMERLSAYGNMGLLFSSGQAVHVILSAATIPAGLCLIAGGLIRQHSNDHKKEH